MLTCHQHSHQHVQCQVVLVPSVELYGWPLVNTHGAVNYGRLFQFSEIAICSQLSLISLACPSQTFSTPHLLLRVRQGQLCSASPHFSQTQLNLVPLLPMLHLSKSFVAVADCTRVTHGTSPFLNCGPLKIGNVLYFNLHNLTLGGGLIIITS